MEYSVIVLILASLGAFFMAFNNGANDVANAFASAVGSKAITVKQALLIAGLLNLVGAVLLGSHVALTMIEKVLDPSLASDPHSYIIGMLSCLAASGLFVLFATITGMPVSSTHAIVGSLTGVVIALGGVSAVNWKVLGWIALSWVVSPFLSGSIAWLSVKIIRLTVFHAKKRKNILVRLKSKVPLFIALTTGFVVYSSLRKNFPPEKTFWGIFDALELGIILAILIYLFVRFLISRWIVGTPTSEKGAESIFRKLQIGTSCYVAFAHGANDVSNSISPVLAILIALNSTVMAASSEVFTVPIWILLLGGLGMALGIGVLGHKVMATLGNKITLLTNSKGFCVDFSTATTVVLASIFGMPVSSTHAATGSIVGVGLENGRRGINFSIFAKILAAWLITVPSSAIITILIFTIAKRLF